MARGLASCTVKQCQKQTKNDGFALCSRMPLKLTALATLRNLALAPLTTNRPRHAHPDTAVLFLNDVAACPDDLLELPHQRRAQAADMACALDWIGDDPPVFYDSYVARAINGDTFFEIPAPSVSWARAAALFWNEPVARRRFAAHRPFQVFACWNGPVVFTARPVVEGSVRFRGPRAERGECHAGEPQVFCKDMWWEGYGRIMVVPGVDLEYSVEKGRAIKESTGFASRLAVDENYVGAAAGPCQVYAVVCGPELAALERDL
ncbi:glycosyltransferase family 69 protein, partial [Trichocladium antarcticum]